MPLAARTVRDMADSEYGRTEWPELVGVDVDEAVQSLREAAPALNVWPVASGSGVTADRRTDRVRLWFEEATRTVSRVPRIG